MNKTLIERCIESLREIGPANYLTLSKRINVLPSKTRNALHQAQKYGTVVPGVPGAGSIPTVYRLPTAVVRHPQYIPPFRPLTSLPTIRRAEICAPGFVVREHLTGRILA